MTETPNTKHQTPNPTPRYMHGDIKHRPAPAQVETFRRRPSAWRVAALHHSLAAEAHHERAAAHRQAPAPTMRLYMYL
jgi:hypothetical protein